MTNDGANDGNDGNGSDAEANEAVEREAALARTIWGDVDRVLSGINASPEPGSLDLIVTIPKAEIVRGLRALKDDEQLRFDYLRNLTAIDYEADGVTVVYHLYSTTAKHNVTVKTVLPSDDLTVDSATAVWKAANWLERETAEMFGVRFNGHPDPRTLLLPEDMTDTFPLRKDHPLAEIEVLQGEGMAYEVEDE